MEIKIFLNNEGKLAEALEGTRGNPQETVQADILAIGTLPNGMTSGATSVGITALTSVGIPVYLETSLKMFQMAAAAFQAKYGDETGGETLIEAELPDET